MSGYAPGVRQISAYEAWERAKPTKDGRPVEFRDWLSSPAGQAHSFQVVDHATGYRPDRPYEEPPTWKQILEAREQATAPVPTEQQESCSVGTTPRAADPPPGRMAPGEGSGTTR